MRQLVKNGAYRLSKPFSLSFLRKRSGESFLFPFYHLISDDTPVHAENLYAPVSVRQFVNDLDFLLTHFQPATTQDVLDFIRKGKKTSHPRFFLSFDDGLRECYEIVAPLLKKKGLEAAFFINPAFTDNKELFFQQKISLIIDKIRRSGVTPQRAAEPGSRKTNKNKEIRAIRNLDYADKKCMEQAGKRWGVNFQDYLRKNQPFMTLEQIRELQQQGFLIGSHSYDHPRFWKISEKERREQLTRSFDFLDTHIHPEIRAFAFPFSDIHMPASFFRFLSETLHLDISFGTAGIKRDTVPNHIQRIPMDASLKPAERTVREEYAYFVMKKFIGKNTLTRSCN
jgi:peptidoglycan/xylan/chitin deacetylase (PgdA/CDA1 family)